MLSKTKAVTFLALLSSILSVATADLDEYTNPDGKTIWDEAPDFSKDEIKPYPDLQGPGGENLTVENLRGVHLFGWKGCTWKEGGWIKEAYNDFYKLAQQPQVYNNIDWNDPAAKDFFGPNSNAYKIPDDTRGEIQQIFAAAQQVYNYWWTWQPPWLAWRQLWIEVRCSGNNGKGDPDDKCGDRAHQPPQCPPRDPGTPVDDEDKRLEAYSEPNEKYSRITFCTKFFDLPTLTEVTTKMKKQNTAAQDNLEYWNNRARCFFHEVTHLDYFMNADDDNDKSKSPEVFDTQFKYRKQGEEFEVEGYGPYNAKILRNHIPKQKKYIGYFTQRNADSYAYFALAKYVQSQIGRYPYKPRPGKIKPTGDPKKSPSGDPLFAEDTGPDEVGETADDALIDGEEDNDHAPGFHVPGCGDKYGKADATTSPPEEGPSDPVLKCHGVGGDVWMLSRDQAVSAAEQFCKQDAKDIQYFQGSADDVKLSLHNHDDSKPISAVADCIGNFKVIIDGCDGNNPTHNPHNYKFGGVSTTTDGWEFKLEPQAKKPTENSCDVSYEFWEDLFEVRGKNFPDAKLGADGEGLKKEIKGCGALTDWSFEWTPDDAKYQWYARGHLPIGTKSCMGRAVQTAGGASSGGCRGAG